MPGLILLAILALTSETASARLLQVIHTNDLHSYFEGTFNEKGGYSRLLTKINELREEARSQGIEVLQLDAGDWGDGTSFFLSQNGKHSVKALEVMGVDVAAIGNHDHLLGTQILGQQLREANTTTKFVAANFDPATGLQLSDVISPFVDLERGGIPIRIIGLTTDEAYFQYSIAPGLILPPSPVGEAQGLLAKAAGKELVIALTHLGVKADEALVRSSTSIDVVIGGHSHTRLSEVDYQKNKSGLTVPIVQAWAHGMSVGSLLLDVKEGGGVTVLNYELHDVTPTLDENPQMEIFIEEVKKDRNLNLSLSSQEVIGETLVPMTGYVDGHPVYKSSCWGRHLATAARQAVGAPVGIHVSSFEGAYRSPGPVTYGDLADNFPHVRKFGDQGWEIVTVFMSGYKLRYFMRWISRRGFGVSFSGLGYKTDDKATYRIAFPAEVALAIKTSLPGYKSYLQGLRYSGKYYWPVMADYLKTHSPLSCP